mmetsp:Transcript_10282/g.18578  ORF Transcript_10282/g.18578 Transcript_10282/m.18578 type:complete len:215 (-) Transcript_10282:35-679(-)
MARLLRIAPLSATYETLYSCSGLRCPRNLSCSAANSGGNREDEVIRAKTSILRVLSFRPASAAQIHLKLTRKGHEEECIETALQQVREMGLQSDAEYAETYARSKWRQSCWAPARISMELSRSGVSQADISTAIDSVFGGGDEEDAMSFSCGDYQSISNASSHMEVLLVEAQKQARQYRNLPKETQRRRLVGWLQRRGHSWAVVREVLESQELM